MPPATTLWAAVVAGRLGYDREAALSLYEAFRPKVARGERGRGRKGTADSGAGPARRVTSGV